MFLRKCEQKLSSLKEFFEHHNVLDIWEGVSIPKCKTCGYRFDISQNICIANSKHDTVSDSHFCSKHPKYIEYLLRRDTTSLAQKMFDIMYNIDMELLTKEDCEKFKEDLIYCYENLKDKVMLDLYDCIEHGLCIKSENPCYNFEFLDGSSLFFEDVPNERSNHNYELLWVDNPIKLISYDTKRKEKQ